jgi:thymidine kinase
LESHIVIHDGVSVPATPIRSWPEIADDVQIVFIDEVQFFERPWFEGDLPEEIRKLLARGIDVFASGLDTDWRGRPFRVTADLFVMADQVTKLRASCAARSQPVTKNFKKIPNDLSVELGKEDKYEVRSNLHWHDHSSERAD